MICHTIRIIVLVRLAEPPEWVGALSVLFARRHAHAHAHAHALAPAAILRHSVLSGRGEQCRSGEGGNDQGRASKALLNHYAMDHCMISMSEDDD